MSEAESNMLRASQIQLVSALEMQRSFSAADGSLASMTTNSKTTNTSLTTLSTQTKVMVESFRLLNQSILYIAETFLDLKVGMISPDEALSWIDALLKKVQGPEEKEMNALISTGSVAPPAKTYAGGGTVDPLRHLKTALAGVGKGLPLKTMGKAFGGIKKVGKAGFNAMGSAFGAMGPQMMLMQAAMGGIGAFLAPMELIGVYFEAYGSILSQLLVPVMEGLMPLFDGLIPIFEQVVAALLPVVMAFMGMLNIDAILPIMNALMPGILGLAHAMEMVFLVITPLNNMLSGAMVVAITAVALAFSYIGVAIGRIGDAFTWLGSLLSPVTDMIDGMSRAFERAIGVLGNITGKIRDFVEDLW